MLRVFRAKQESRQVLWPSEGRVVGEQAACG